MRVLLLAAGLLALVGAVFLAAEMIKSKPQNPQVVPHPAGNMLAVNFAHADHIEQNCVVCHHNFVDDTGIGMCFDCHKTDPEVAPLIEEQFHDLCRNCHLEEQAASGEHGPTRQCIDCHVRDDKP